MRTLLELLEGAMRALRRRSSSRATSTRLWIAPPAVVSQYEQGRTRPSAATLAALSLQLGFPPEFLERGRPAVRIDQSQTHFRRLRLTSKLDRDRLVVRLELQAELLGRIEEHVRLPVVSIPSLLVDPEERWPRPMQERTSMGDRVPSRSANGNLDGSGGLVVDG